MPIELEDKMYHFYDLAVARTFKELTNKSHYDSAIYLRGFDRGNKEHLFILRTALMVRDLNQIPVEIECSWWDAIVLNWKIRKNFNKIKRMDSNGPGGFWVTNLISKIKCELKEETGICFYLDDIYDTYYEGSCG